MGAGEQHTCLTEEYLTASSALFEDALLAEEIFSADELEEHARSIISGSE